MRTKTPPELKWLLVERATLAGDICLLEMRQVELAAELVKLRAKVQAMDTTIRLCSPNVRTDAAGSIRRHTREYGYRGALKDFIVATLQESPVGLTKRAVAVLARDHFGLQFVSREELSTFKVNVVGMHLRRLRQAGLVESFEGDDLLWSWKRGPSTFAELALLVGAGPASGPKGAVDGNQDPSGH